jgi:hypothetical protein
MNGEGDNVVNSKMVLADFMVDAVDEQVRQQQAVVISEGRITAVGHRDAILQEAPPTVSGSISGLSI